MWIFYFLVICHTTVLTTILPPLTSWLIQGWRSAVLQTYPFCQSHWLSRWWTGRRCWMQILLTLKNNHKTWKFEVYTSAKKGVNTEAPPSDSQLTYCGAALSSLEKSSCLAAMFSTMASTTRSDFSAAPTASSTYWIRDNVWVMNSSPPWRVKGVGERRGGEREGEGEREREGDRERIHFHPWFSECMHTSYKCTYKCIHTHSYCDVYTQIWGCQRVYIVCACACDLFRVDSTYIQN